MSDSITFKLYKKSAKPAGAELGQAQCMPEIISSMYIQTYNPIKIDGHTLEFSKQAEHVGVIRSTEGKAPYTFLTATSSSRSDVVTPLVCLLVS